ncbi:MAG: hypothetical protein WB760_30770, partial [Xanthobacteraceae bacterium]
STGACSTPPSPAVRNHRIAVRLALEWVSALHRISQVYGYLSFNDFLGNPHQHRWCASWGAYQLPNRAVAHGFIYDTKTPPAYIKRT